MDEMYVMVRTGIGSPPRGGSGIGALADESWVEDNEGSAALLRRSAGRAGFEARIERTAADLMGKMALVAAGHAVALVPGVLAPSLRRDVVAVALGRPAAARHLRDHPGGGGATSGGRAARRRAGRALAELSDS